MNQIIQAVLLLLQEIAPILNNASAIGKIIDALVQLIPVIISTAQDLVPMVKNVIAALKSNTAITDDQMAALEVAEAQLDADFEAAAAAAQEG